MVLTKSYFEERKSCPACASNEISLRYQTFYCEPPIKEYLQYFYSSQGVIEFEYLYREEYILCDCKNCGLIFQKKIPNSALMDRLYEYWISPSIAFEHRRNMMSQKDYNRFAQEIIQIGSFFKENPANVRILDFGMGWADWLLMATGFGYQCYGMELSESRIKYAQSRGIKVLNWEDAEQKSFDFINTEQVFEHIPNPLETLKKLKTLLKPGGIIKISVPTTNDIDRRLKLMDWGAKKGMRNSLNAISPLEHIQYFKRSSLDKMAEMAGMTEVKISVICQYNKSFGWFNHKDLVRNALLPIYRNLLRKQNYVFLSPKLD